MMLCRLLPVLMVPLLFICGSFPLQIRNNGYENMVIAISEKIPEDSKMIDEIKSMFTDASAFLYIATKRRTFMRSVTILIPSTWADNPKYENVERETFDKAEVRIDPRSNPFHGNGPYTRQVKECGEPGDYIHLTPSYVLDVGFDRTKTWGPVGKLLVHEFAHLRYGVFDEYINQPDSNQYTYGCSEETVIACEDSDDPLIQRECDSDRPKASIMYKQFISSIDSFCESNSLDPFLKHNPYINNYQNLRCSNKGTWDVISSHVDFSDGLNIPVDIEDTSPSFKIVYPRTANCLRQVLVMDISGSMNVNRMFKLGQMASKLIKDILPMGTELGMVAFNTIATIWRPMTVLENDDIKNEMIDSVPKHNDVGGFTAIGKGMLESIKLLQQGGRSAVGSIVFLLSDGAENVSPYIKDVIDDVVASGVVVFTLAISRSASDGLVSLASVSGGEFYLESESSESTSFDGALTSRLAEELNCATTEGKPPVELTRHTSILPGDKSWISESVRVDPTVGNHALFTFTYPPGTEIEVTLTGPSTVYYKNSPEYDHDDQLNIIRFRIRDAEPGWWTYHIRNVGTVLTNQVMIVTAISYPRDEDDPITAKAYMSAVEVSYGNKAVIYAEVTKGYRPVVKAEVLATVDRPSAGPVDVVLLDDGQGADFAKDDGVYCAYFTAFTGNGKYSVDVKVSTTADTSVITSGIGSGGAARSTTGTPPQTVLEPVDSFDRITSGGGFILTNFTPNADPYPPSRITDLKAEEYSFDDATVTLSWTAPGGDLDQGIASHYDLRRAETFDELGLSFSESFQINTSCLDPLPAKTYERHVIQLPKIISLQEKHVFGIRAFDDALNIGDVSNLISVVNIRNKTDISESKLIILEPQNNISTTPIIAGILGALAGLILTGAIVLLVRKRFRYKFKSTVDITADP